MTVSQQLTVTDVSMLRRARRSGNRSLQQGNIELRGVCKKALSVSTKGVFLRCPAAEAATSSLTKAGGGQMKSRRVQQGSPIRIGALGCAVALLMLSGCQGGKRLPTSIVQTGGAPGVRSFVLSNVYIAAPPEESNACPHVSEGPLELFLKSLPVGEQRQYATPDKREPLMRLMNQRMGFRFAPVSADPKTHVIGPAQVAQKRRELGIPEGKGGLYFLGKIVTYDSCSDPDDFPQFDQGLQPYEGKHAYGIDLDARRGPEDFVGVGGENGVDNQLWRALGCEWAFRENGKPEVAAKVLFSARAPTLVEISGIDDARNDGDVQVSIYTGTTPLTVDGTGHPLARASFDVSSDPRMQAHTRGRIIDGVLTTEPFDVQLSYKEQIIDAVRKLRATRLRATLKPDGTIEGGFYGYYDVESFWRSIQQMTQLGASLSRLSCPAVHSALNQYADGFPDPQTGRKTAISAALRFDGVRAHVIHPPAGA
jgi:hypothetical protein